MQPSVATADANYNGNVRFGSNRSYMTERTAMHEISHTLGIGQTSAFDTKCAANDWATATPLLRSWDGSSAKINCGGGHIWPYGLNVSSSIVSRCAPTCPLNRPNNSPHFNTRALTARAMPNAHPREALLSETGEKLKQRAVPGSETLPGYVRIHRAGPQSTKFLYSR